MADSNGGHLVARTLKQAGVGHIFTLCGGHILPIYDGCVKDGIGVVDVRHEQAAAHADDGWITPIATSSAEICSGVRFHGQLLWSAHQAAAW